MKANKNKINEIDCSEAAKRFNDYIDDYLNGKARQELVHHIENCRHCFDRIEFENMLKKKISSIRKNQPADKKANLDYIENILSKKFAM